MKKLSLLILIVFAMSLVPTVGWAASPWTEKESTGDKMMGKLGFGLKNTLLGWTEIIRQPIKGGKENGVGGVFEGLTVGLFHGVYDTFGGALHLVTFPLTSVDVPLPEDGVDCGCMK